MGSLSYSLSVIQSPDHKGRGDSSVRVMLLAKLLEFSKGQGYTVQELASICDACPRTIWRDLKTIKRAGGKLEEYQDGQQQKRFRSLRYPNWPPIEIEQRLRECREAQELHA